MIPKLDFYRGRRVFVTGHTGFKGAWLCRILALAGADVTGYALEPPTDPSLFELLRLGDEMKSIKGDVRNFESLEAAYREADPEIVFHLAAQPIVRESYRIPRETFETNVMGTVNLLECVRLHGAESVVNVTTDKVYKNDESGRAFPEDEPLAGYDPYSNSKSCSELVTYSYRGSFFDPAGIPVSTVRAGNVIGGGDFAADRIIPDCVRAASAGEPMIVRNPNSVRPFQHVSEALTAYLTVAEKQFYDKTLAGAYNSGPDAVDCVTAGEVARIFCEKWGDGARLEIKGEIGAPHEAGLLRLDSTKIRETFGLSPKWHVEESVEKTVAFAKVMAAGGNLRDEIDRQIKKYWE